MRYFNDIKGYATQANAIAKLVKVIGEDYADRFHWMITVNEQGRFIPTVRLDDTNRWHMVGLANAGIAVIA